MASVVSWKLIAFGSAAVAAGFAFTSGCSSSDNSARNGTGGSASAGTGGTSNTTGGSNSSAGSNAVAGSNSSGGNGSAGTAGMATGGSTSGGGCTLPTTTAMNALIYNGVTTAPSCGTTLPAPRSTFWFSYGDNSVCTGASVPADTLRAALVPALPPCTAADAGAIKTNGMMGGCDGATDCAFHASGSGYTDFGAGVGFDLLDDSTQTAQPVDATIYPGGLQFYAKGTISGTRGVGYANVPQSLHIKFVTATDRKGDDFGGYCTISATDWTKCSVTWAAAKRDGFATMPDPATDKLDIDMLEKIQFEFSKFSQAADAGAVTPVAFDLLIDDVSFF